MFTRSTLVRSIPFPLFPLTRHPSLSPFFPPHRARSTFGASTSSLAAAVVACLPLPPSPPLRSGAAPVGLRRRLFPLPRSRCQPCDVVSRRIDARVEMPGVTVSSRVTVSSQVGNDNVSPLSFTFLSQFYFRKDMTTHSLLYFMTPTFRCPSRRQRHRDPHLGRQDRGTRRLHRAFQHRECFSAGIRDPGTCWRQGVVGGRGR